MSPPKTIYKFALYSTFVCPTEIISFSEKVNEFKAAGAEVVACSVDSEFSHLAWVNTPRKQGGLGEMKIPILADITKKIASDYGVLLDGGVALRGVFIIDPKQNVRVAMINDLPIGRNVDEVIRLVEAVKFTDIHGEVCPANWKKGGATMIAEPAKSKAYFEKANA